MDTALHIATRKTLTTAERKAAGDKAEREADMAFVARMKKRGPAKPEDCIPWAEVKKDLGL